MKTQVKHQNKKPDKTFNDRRKIINDIRMISPLDAEKNADFVLKQNDYQDLMAIKEHRLDRERNNSRLFFWMGLSMTLGFLLFAFNWKTYDKGMIGELEMVQNTEFEELVEIPLTEQLPPPAPIAIQQPIIVEVPDELILEDIKINMDVEISEDMVIEQVVFDELLPIEEEKAEEIFQIVEQNPEPIGGMAAFYKFVGENIKYPSEALKQDIEGKVFVKFVVSKTGKISNVQVMKGIGGGCDEEAARIIAMAPDWKPGKQRGKEVNVYMMLPVIFKMNN